MYAPIPSVIVQPDPGHTTLQCRCGSFSRRVHVRPVKDGAVITELVCENPVCNNVLKVRNVVSMIEVDGVHTDMKGNRVDG